jgi:hypothetical protein
MDENPFRFGALALGDAFTDRTKEIRELRRDIVSGQDVVLFGPRRYGKSSLVLRVVRDLAARRVLTAYVDLSTTPTKERLAEKLARAIHQDVASRLERARDRALALFRDLRIQPTITLDPHDASVSFSFQPGGRPADVDATIEELLALPGRIASERNRKVALVLDEFQEITEIDRHYPRLMRAVFQTQPEVAHVYLGSKRHLLERIFNDANEPFWRSAKRLELGPIPKEDFAAYLHRRFAETGRTITDAAADELLDRTGGHPYATQQLAYFVWDVVPRGKPARTEEIAEAVDRLVDAEHNHFSLLWEESTRNERLLLLALAAEPGRPFAEAYRRAHGLPAATNVQRSLASLRRRELVARRDDNLYAIAEPFLDAWLERTQREPRVR